MDLFQISGSALTAERLRAEVATSNLANCGNHPHPGRRTLPAADGGVQQPSRRRSSACCWPARWERKPLAPAGGVRVNQVVDDPTPPLRRYEPGHPDADASGYVDYPAISPVQEMVDLMGAERAYELNASAVQAAKQMIQQSLQILK